jgi:hypothetical protein
MESERKKNVKEKENKDYKFDATENANMVSNVIIEDYINIEIATYFVLQLIPL